MMTLPLRCVYSDNDIDDVSDNTDNAWHCVYHAVIMTLSESY